MGAFIKKYLAGNSGCFVIVTNNDLFSRIARFLLMPNGIRRAAVKYRLIFTAVLFKIEKFLSPLYLPFLIKFNNSNIPFF